MIYDLIIIGAGPAGLTAGIYAGRKKLKTTILTKQIGGPTVLSSNIENYPGYLRIAGVELASQMREQIEKYKIPLKEDVAITGIEKSGNIFSVKAENGENFETKTVIIATGEKFKKLNVPGAPELEGKGVSFCTTCDAPLFSGKTVAVIGGGNAALKSAVDLLSYAEKIYILQHRQKFTGDEIIQEQLRLTGKVEFLMNAETKEIKGKDFIEGLLYEDLITKEKKELKVAGIFVNIGRIPNSDFARSFLNLNKEGEIVINPLTNGTSVPGVFAAGDVTNIPYKQYIIAAGEGAKAALSAYHYICNISAIANS